MVQPKCKTCGQEGTSFNVTTGDAFCAAHVAANGLRFDVRKLSGVGFAIYRVSAKADMYEIDFIHEKNALIYAWGRMLEERSFSHPKKATP